MSLIQFFAENKDGFSILISLMQFLGSLGIIAIGIIGLSTWSKQIKGSYAFDLSKRISNKLVYTKAEIRKARSPFSDSNESNTALKKYNVNVEGKSLKELYDLGSNYVRLDRRNRIVSLYNEIEGLFYEGEAFWGSEFSELSTPFRGEIMDIIVKFEFSYQYIDNRREERDYWKEVEEAIYSRDDDKHTVNLKRLTDNLLQFLRPYLKMESGKSFKFPSG